jgi:hypothetical protein
MKRSTKATLLMILMALVTARGAALEREGTILFEPELFAIINQHGIQNVLRYRLDETNDFIEDRFMEISDLIAGPAYGVLARYLRPGTTIIYEDEGLRPFEGFGSGRMMGFFTPDGNYVRLDQMFSADIIQRYFPDLWAKMQAEQRGGR